MKLIRSSDLAVPDKHPLDGQRQLLLPNKGEVMQHVRTMHKDFLDGYFFGYRYANFVIDRTIFHAREECVFEACINNPEPMIVVSYAMQGNVDNTFDLDGIKNNIQRNQTAITLVTDEKKVSNRRLMPETVESGHIFLPEKYIRSLAERYPDEVGPLDDMIDKIQGNSALVTGRETTPFIANCLQSLFLPPMLGNCIEDFMEQQIIDYFAHVTECDKVSKANWEQASNHILVSKMHDALDILKRNFREPLSLHSLALAVGTNECYLKAGFRHEFHQSVYAYLYEYRMQMAVRYLLDTEKSIEDISSLVGYEYAAHFITAFKRRFKITPLEFKLRMKKVSW